MTDEVLNDLRGAAVRKVQRDDAVVITGAEYLSLRLKVNAYRHALEMLAEGRWNAERPGGTNLSPREYARKALGE